MSAANAASLSLAAGNDRLSPRDFARLASYIYRYSGIKMPDSKRTMLEGRLRRRLRALGLATMAEYCTHVFAGDNLAVEGLHLINAVTTNKTDFFREPVHFDFLRETVLPEFRARRLDRIRAWSCACSSGPEPYSMAMVLDDFAEEEGGPSYGILATDLDTEMLAAARAGIYAPEIVDPVPDRLRAKYVMMPRDPSRAQVRIVPELRSAIGFARLNLMDSHYPVGEPMHLIFCRNVLIYFDKETQRQVVSRLLERLAPGGYLFLGHSESIADARLPLEQVASTTFRRPA